MATCSAKLAASSHYFVKVNLKSVTKITFKKNKNLSRLPSVYNNINFTTLTDSQKIDWFIKKRIEAWLINDTRKIKTKGKSLFGLVAMVCIGVEALARFRYGDNLKSNKRFPKFLEEYVDSDFGMEIDNKFVPNPPLTGDEDLKWFYKSSRIRYSQIFYVGMRNQLMHNFAFKHSMLIEPRKSLLRWNSRNKILYVEADQLLDCFEKGIKKYSDELENSRVGDDIHTNFIEIFRSNFMREF